MDENNKFTFIISQIYVDDGDDVELVDKKLVGFLRKIHSQRRLVVYIATEPVVQEDGHHGET